MTTVCKLSKYWYFVTLRVGGLFVVVVVVVVVVNVAVVVVVAVVAVMVIRY